MDLTKLRALRRAKGYTLARLAGETGLTESYLSQIERGMKAPAIATLKKIAAAYDMDVVDLLWDETDTAGEQSGCRDVERVDAGRRKAVRLPGVRPPYLVFTRNGFSEQKRQGGRGLVCELEPGVYISPRQLIHVYEEIVYVQAGQMTCRLGRDTVTLAEGDSLYIPPGTPHNFGNESDRLTVIVAYTR